MSHNLYHRFASNFPADGGKPVLIDGNGVVATYQIMEEKSACIANLLTEMGTAIGDRVTVQVDKSTDGLWLYLGCLRAGLVFHPLNTAYQANEL